MVSAFSVPIIKRLQGEILNSKCGVSYEDLILIFITLFPQLELVQW